MATPMVLVVGAYSMMDTVSSRRAGRKIRKKALTMPGRTKGITISFRDCHMLAPQERDASIRESCTCSRAAELAFREKAM